MTNVSSQVESLSSTVNEIIISLSMVGENAKKWLIIGCWIGQRVSDLLTITPGQIRPSKNKGIYVDIFSTKNAKTCNRRGN